MKDILMSHQTAILGYIGDGYQRFYIHYMSVDCDTCDDGKWLIKGRTKVKDNVCDFNGWIAIKSITPADGECYIMCSDICLNENKEQYGTGMITGILTTKLYLKGNKYLYYDKDIEYSDGFRNNSFVGKWKSYKTGYEKKCCWGEYRIPNSGDLDIGAGEFSPNEKYRNNGWQDYMDAYIYGTADGWKKENSEWWKK